jgi:hypothetical protein
MRASVYEFFTNPPTLRLHNRAAKIGNGCAYPKRIYYNKFDKGGHFAAWEQPGLLASEVCAAFRRLRSAT